ncbi:hypothetical protein G647_03171 [Cladophialophora carrionii CBS 160.54]|uniref:Myb-like DNA-binding domain-containing protein n=1 Tax=Cladophialophora carrionii CBS 160.54 TaxID=1279043 RepID=V9DHN4_9EURO|nr:uncharacterized protein G647_03171 [Cladophialophora carrionii CBS 160.54]ETI26394.1 hypothetical protein G647_03171 [Cladophialophora carrionii CBS 160.54]
MSAQSDADKLVYVMTILKNTEMAKPDYHAAAVEAGINNANNAQKRFRAIVKGAGFDLVDGQVVSADGSGPAPTAPAATAKKGRAKKADGAAPKKTAAKKAPNGTASKKRKLDTPAVDSASEGEKEDDGPGEQDAINKENTSDGTA